MPFAEYTRAAVTGPLAMASTVIGVSAGADGRSTVADLARLVTAGGIQLPALVDAYRSGGGVSWAQYGPDMRSGQADMNRPWFLAALGSDWFPAVPDLDERLRAGGRVDRDQPRIS